MVEELLANTELLTEMAKIPPAEREAKLLEHRQQATAAAAVGATPIDMDTVDEGQAGNSCK